MVGSYHALLIRPFELRNVGEVRVRRLRKLDIEKAREVLADEVKIAGARRMSLPILLSGLTKPVVTAERAHDWKCSFERADEVLACVVGIDGQARVRGNAVITNAADKCHAVAVQGRLQEILLQLTQRAH